MSVSTSKPVLLRKSANTEPRDVKFAYLFMDLFLFQFFKYQWNSMKGVSDLLYWNSEPFSYKKNIISWRFFTILVNVLLRHELNFTRADPRPAEEAPVSPLREIWRTFKWPESLNKHSWVVYNGHWVLTSLAYIAGLVQDCSISIATHWRYWSLTLSHWYNIYWSFHYFVESRHQRLIFKTGGGYTTYIISLPLL